MIRRLSLGLILGFFSVNCALAGSFICPSVAEFQKSYLQYKNGDVVTISGIQFTLGGNFGNIPSKGDTILYYGSLIRNPIPNITNYYSFDCAYQTLSGKYNYDMATQSNSAITPVRRMNWGTTRPAGFACGNGNYPDACSVNFN